MFIAGLAVFVVLPLGLLRNVDSLAAVCVITIVFYMCLVLKVLCFVIILAYTYLAYNLEVTVSEIFPYIIKTIINVYGFVKTVG